MTVKVGTLAITSGTTVCSVAHNLANSGYITALAPSWNTTTWILSKSANAATIRFGTQATSGGGNLDWRAET